MTTKYCPRNEIKKIEAELWNLKVKGTDVVAYNQRFQELALLCDRMFPEETDKIERYVGGMPDLIYSSVVASKPKTMQEAIEMATELMDRRINTFAERQAENKRKFEDTSRNNQNQQQNKRQNTGRAYAAGNGDKKPYEGTKPLCPKCNFNHYGPCIPTCNNCKKLGHLAKDCRSRPATANNNNNNRNNNNNNNRNNNNPRAQGENTNAIVCFECGAPGHFKKDCPQWKNKNQGNGNAVAKAYAVGVAGQNQTQHCDGVCTKWLINEGSNKITAWSELVGRFFCKYYPLSRAGKYDVIRDDEDERHDYFEFVKGGGNNELIDNIVTSNEEWQESDNGNPRNTDIDSLFTTLFGCSKKAEQAHSSPINVPFVLEAFTRSFLPEDDVLPAEEQPFPVAASPTTESPGYIPEFDPEEDLEEDDEEDPKEDPADYPADRGDDRDDEEPSDDDDDDDDDAEERERPLSSCRPATVA
ncbi:putative reverse transcriptase domain-containing protein [Tanacetum coccineum]